MDIGRDVLTRTLLGSTEAEKVFTPWWITVHHYLVYAIVILGKSTFSEIGTESFYRLSSLISELHFLMNCVSTIPVSNSALFQVS